MNDLIAARDWATFPWNAFVWFMGVNILTFLMEWKGEVLKAKDPEIFPKRRVAVLVYGFIIGVINLTQMIMWVQLIDSFNLLATSLLFIRFWRIEKGHKRSMARNMGFLMLLFALLSFVTAFVEVAV